MGKVRSVTREAGIEPMPRRYKDWIDRELVRDTRISFRALGIAVRLLSNAPGFRMASQDLADESTDREGRDAVRRALKELEEAGYLSRTRTRLPNGHCVTKVLITDELEPRPETSLAGPRPEKPVSAPRPENTSSAPRPENPAAGVPNAGSSGAKSSNNSFRNSTRRKSTTTTPPTLQPGGELAWPTPLTPQEITVVGQLITGLSGSQQQELLDELQGAYDEGKPPKRLAGWVRELAARTKRGEFLPDLGLQVAKARSTRHAASEAKRRDQVARAIRRSDPNEFERRRATLEKVKEELCAAFP